MESTDAVARPLGGLRLGETVFPVRGLRLAAGGVVVWAVLPGPVDIPAGQSLMLYGGDGELVLRGLLDRRVHAVDGAAALFEYQMVSVGRRSVEAEKADVAAALAEGVAP
jgi:hypothetical protein